MGPGPLRCGGEARDHPHPHSCCCFGVPPSREVDPASGPVSVTPPRQQAGMCWQQLPALLATLGIPHILGMLAMPLAWALPSAPSMGLGTSSWGACPTPSFGDTSCTPLPVLPHLPAPLPSLTPSTCQCPGQAVAPLAAPSPPSPRPQPRGCRNACLESHAGLGLPGNWET